MRLTVSRDLEGKHGLFELPVEDILFCESNTKQKDWVIFHTSDSVYHAPGTLKFWTEALKSSGFEFEIVDRTNVVNLVNVLDWDPFYREAHFTKDRSAKKCTVSIKNASIIISHLRLQT